ncbi:MAG: RNA methyltransferase [Solobacterium sp.]|nr:RNA methyltransferase [Solobacterium sp.]
MEKIVSLNNAKVMKWNSLHKKKYRDEYGLFLVEGEHLVSEARRAGQLDTLVSDGTVPFEFENTVYVSEAVMKKLSANVSQVHLIGVCRCRQTVEKETERVLLLDGVQDPGNLGTLVRTAVSFGFDAVYCSEECCDLYNEKAVRSTQGALFHIPVLRRDLNILIPMLRRDGFRIYGTSLQESRTMSEITEGHRMAFVLGNEGQGVHPEIIGLCDSSIRIEMDGFESLNVAVAGGIIMYHFRKK